MLIFVISISITTAYASQEVPVTLPIDKETDFNIKPCILFFSEAEFKVIYTCSFEWTIAESLFYKMPKWNNILPDDENEKTITNFLNSFWTPPLEEVTKESEPEPPKPTVEDILKEKLPPGIKFAIDRLGECEYGKQDWGIIQQSSSYEVPDQFIYGVDDYKTDVLVGKLNKAYEACRGQKEYPLPGSYKAFWLADLTGLDFHGRLIVPEPRNDPPMSTPLTKQDFIDQEQISIDLPKTYIDPYQGCIPEDENDKKCVNRGNPEINLSTEVCNSVGAGLDKKILCKQQILNDWLSEQAARDLTKRDTDRAVEVAQNTICDTYKFTEGVKEVENQAEWYRSICSVPDKVCLKGVPGKGLQPIDCSELE